jgi:RimJ/RimL family protein N-acetyltransferase
VAIGSIEPAFVRTASKSPDIARAGEHWLQRAEQGDDTYYFGVFLGERLVGQILLHDIDPGTGEALVAYHLFEPDLRGRGIGTRALGLLGQFVADETGLRRLVMITSSDNIASRRIAEKNGFVHIGAPREDPSGVLMIWDVRRGTSP